MEAIKTVIAFNGQDREITRYNKLIEQLRSLTTKKGLILGFSSGLSGFFNTGGYIVYIALGTYLQTNEPELCDAGLVMQVEQVFLLFCLFAFI